MRKNGFRELKGIVTSQLCDAQCVKTSLKETAGRRKRKGNNEKKVEVAMGRRKREEKKMKKKTG
jgi:hypothetical protein